MILFVTDRQTLRGLSVSHFLSAGIFSYVCPIETARFLCEKKDISGAIIDGVPALSQAEALVGDLRLRYPELPMALIAPPDSVPNASAEVIRNDADLPVLADALISFIRERVGWKYDLTTYSLSLPSDSAEATLLGYPFPLSPREAVILRCLFAFAPRVVSSDDLLTLCFPEGTQRAANLSVQISRINRRAANIGLPDLIVSEYGKGYRLNRAII